jgi:hypothetical protein
MNLTLNKMDIKDDYPDRVKYDNNILSLYNINSQLDEILVKFDKTRKDDESIEEQEINKSKFTTDNKPDIVDTVYLSSLETTIKNCIITDILEICHLFEILYLLKCEICDVNINYLNIINHIRKHKLYNKKYICGYLSVLDEEYSKYIRKL